MLERQPDRQPGGRRSSRAGALRRWRRSRPRLDRRRSTAGAASAPSLWPDAGFSSTSAYAATSPSFGYPHRRNSRRFDGAIKPDAKFIEAVSGRHAPPHGGRPAHRRHGRGRAPPEGRHQRRRPAKKLADQPCPTTASSARRSARTPSPVSAAGIAIDGRFRPVVEFMYPDFMWVAADQVFNQIGKARHMFGGESAVPLVLRTKVAMGTGYGSQHSMDPAGIFATSPGWRIVAPSTPFDYVGLMNSALGLRGSGARDRACRPLRLDRPGTGRRPRLFHPARQGQGACGGGRRSRSSTYLAMVPQPLDERSRRLGIDAELIDLRSLDRAGTRLGDDRGARCARPNNVLIVEQGPIGTSYGGHPGGGDPEPPASTGSTSRSSACMAARRRRAFPRCWKPQPARGRRTSNAACVPSCATRAA